MNLLHLTDRYGRKYTIDGDTLKTFIENGFSYVPLKTMKGKTPKRKNRVIHISYVYESLLGITQNTNNPQHNTP